MMLDVLQDLAEQIEGLEVTKKNDRTKESCQCQQTGDGSEMPDGGHVQW